MSKLPQPKFERTIRIYGSDLVRSVQYDPATAVLDAQLHTGDTYRYRDVTAQDFTKLVTTKSAGQAFNATIKKFWWGGARKAYKLRG
jgi:hypothetical protein